MDDCATNGLLFDRLLAKFGLPLGTLGSLVAQRSLVAFRGKTQGSKRDSLARGRCVTHSVASQSEFLLQLSTLSDRVKHPSQSRPYV
jgi:hypothetical protein